MKSYGRAPTFLMATGYEQVLSIAAALAGSPELERIKREYEVIFLDKCRAVLTPFIGQGTIGAAGLRAMLGAAEALSHAAAAEEITPAQAEDELFATLIGLVQRSTR